MRFDVGLVSANEVKHCPPQLFPGWETAQEYCNRQNRGRGVVSHLIADGLDIQKAKDPRSGVTALTALAQRMRVLGHTLKARLSHRVWP
jgi:hypothetical protein